MTDPGPIGYRSIDVTAAVQADLAAPRIRSQYRIRFEQTANGDNVTDLVLLTDTENSHNGGGGLP